MSQKKYYYDDNFFEKIDSEAKAYYLGLLYADGYINNLDNYNYVELTLLISDKEILEKFYNELKSNRKIIIIEKKTGLYARLVINSEKIVSDLIKLGCTNKKTHTLKFPENLDDDLIHHMIRGFFDGDGCIWSNKNNDYNIQFDGNYDFLIGIEKYFIKKLNVNKKIKLSKRHLERKDNIVILKYGGNNITKAIYNLLYYKATLFFIRKKNKFDSLFLMTNVNNKYGVDIEYSGVTYCTYNINKIYDIIINKTGLSRKKIRSRIGTGWTVYDIIKYAKNDKNKKSIIKLDQDLNIIETYISLSEASKKNNCNPDLISKNIKENKLYKKFYWKFENE